MASVSSLDQDMRNLRMSRYTPQAAAEVRTWIEEVLGEKIASGDLLDALKDGTALCKLANLALHPPGIRFKKSAMPFMQMENISHFLRACEEPPFNMHAHDRFLTVDLYESKDPAQVLQCITAFSRRANALNPSRFPSAIGPKRAAGVISPTNTGGGAANGGFSSSGYGRPRGNSNQSYAGSSTFNPISRPGPERALSPALTGGSATSKRSDGPTSPSGPVSSWSKKSDVGSTAPAWNIHQYGYLGGASQGNQGIAFGARRQITSAAPKVPSLAEKERLRREKEAEDERLRVQAEEAEHKRRVEREAEEARERIEEERRWEEEAHRQREAEKRRVEDQKREWEEQEQRWKAEEEVRQREEKAVLKEIESQKSRSRTPSNADPQLRGQYLSQYQAEQQPPKPKSRQVSYNDPERQAERERVQELERQLAEAKERERQYEMEKQERIARQDSFGRSRSRNRPPSTSARYRGQSVSRVRDPSPKGSEVSWAGDEREYLRQQWNQTQSNGRTSPGPSSRPLPDPLAATRSPLPPSRPLPEPGAMAPPPLPTSPRPLPDPQAYSVPATQPTNRTSRFLASNAPPVAPKPSSHIPSEFAQSSEAERNAEDARRVAGQQKTKAGGWASKSLLEREMERERQRQKEWEESQKEISNIPRDDREGVHEGQTWDVNQYGYLGGDSQNRGGSGIGFGGRRQIIGPRPLGGKP
ncbi:hypothetical protein K402DRAFT_366895 [Aulographum hederae CBS 113979]|uniref:Calponin-homology (CH) domain-containing protein n=1 Tax=Aulographum hederae CBS 113979 TaxID=1176131 RepID=A0A6G1HH65_9PEZI|nr:hypothetical protein K402DRAFT_366895 [Aulographum hederae CBS 113979]